MADYRALTTAFFKSNLICVAFDLETTGLEAKQDRIAEIGAVKFDRYGPIARFSRLVNPGIPMPAEASKVNGLSDEMLANEADLACILPDFLDFITGSTLVAHNAPFDCGFINAALSQFRAQPNSQINFSSLANPIVDSRMLAKRAFPGRQKYNLQELASFLGIKALDAHRALDDARVCMELFRKCAEALSD